MRKKLILDNNKRRVFNMIKIEGYDHNIEVLEDRLILVRKGSFGSDANKVIYLKDIVSTNLNECKGDSTGSITFTFKLEEDIKKGLYFLSVLKKKIL